MGKDLRHYGLTSAFTFTDAFEHFLGKAGEARDEGPGVALTA